MFAGAQVASRVSVPLCVSSFAVPSSLVFPPDSGVFTYECSPSPQIKIMTPTLLNKFKENVRKCIVAIAQPNNFKNVQNMFNIIKTYKLDKDVIVQEYTTSYQIKQR